MHIRFLAASLMIASALIVSSTSANAQSAKSGFYFAGKGGPSFLDASGIESSGGGALSDTNALNMVGAFGMAAGYTWLQQGLPLRTELELMNRTELTYDASPLFSSGAGRSALASTVQDVSMMLRGYWHFDAGSPTIWTPFLSAGIGIARNAVKGDLTPIAAGGTAQHLDKVTYAPAWSAGFGASFYLGHDVVNDIELRYVDLDRKSVV